MSRSYKKTPWAGENKGKKKKRLANHCVRSWLKQHPEEPLNQNNYKKIYDSWEICDYGWTCSWEEYWKGQVRAWYHWGQIYGKPFPDKKTSYRNWLKSYRNK